MLSPQHQALRQAAQTIANQYTEQDLRNIFMSPLVILSAPRSGSTLLFETLRCSNSLWSIATESHIIFNAFPQLHPAQRQFDSGSLSESEATSEICHLMRACFLVLAQNQAGTRYLDIPEEKRPAQIILLEKTPRNALNIPFLLKLFPDMKVLFLFRDPRETIASIMEAWEIGLKTKRFVTFPNLPGWDRLHWCLLLPPGWRALQGKSLAEIASFQWTAANQTILNDLKPLDRNRWLAVRYRDLIDDTPSCMHNITKFARIPLEGVLLDRTSSSLPLSSTTISAPAKNKWRRYGGAIEDLDTSYSPLERELNSISKEQSKPPPA